MADVTREEFDALKARVDKLDPPTPSPTTFLTISATSTDKAVLVLWSPLEGKALPVSYTVGRNGTDSLGSGPWSAIDGPTIRSRTFDKLLPKSTYTFTVKAIYADGSTQMVTKEITTAATPVVVTPTGKVAWSSGVWCNQDSAAAAAFETKRGQALGNIVVFTSRQSWDAQLGTWWMYGLTSKFAGDLVIKIPTWTEDGDKGSQSDWQTLAGQIKSIKANAWVCLGWEMNLPGWNHALTASNSKAWIAQYRTAVGYMRTVAPDLRFAWNPNAGGDQSGYSQRAAFQQLKDLHVGYGPDSYDAWPADVDAAGWNTHLTATGYLGESYNYAIANKMLFVLPEWGVASGSQWAGHQGGDNPKYIDDYLNFLKSKDPKTIGFDSYFYEPSSYLKSDWVSNPKAAAAYVAQFK